MRFANVDNIRTEAQSGLKAICPGCAQTVIARCGDRRGHHWAHGQNKMCDRWGEPETEWHRAWKNNFHQDWQEVFLPDERTGEKHMADISTPHGLVAASILRLNPKSALVVNSFIKIWFGWSMVLD